MFALGGCQRQLIISPVCSGYGTYKVGVVPASASSAAPGPEKYLDAVNPADCVRTAIECGYRFFDCAEFYANEVRGWAARVGRQVYGRVGQWVEVGIGGVASRAG